VFPVIPYHASMVELRARFSGLSLGAFAAVGASTAAALVIGALSANNTVLAISAAVAILMIAVVVKIPVLVPVAALPATLMQARVGNVLSISDVVLALASIFALFMLSGRGASVIKPFIWAGTFYLAATIPTLILNPYQADFIEWVHEVFLIIGSLIVGFVVGRENRATLALSLYLVACFGIAVAVVIVSLVGYLHTGAFQAAYLPNLQKNTTGGMLAAGAVIVYARPAWLNWHTKWTNLTFAVLLIGIFAAQSRQGVVALIVGMVIVSLRPRPQTGKRPKLVWLMAIPGVILVVSGVMAQLASGNQFNSANQRLAWYADSINIWLTSTVFGVGMRWWYTDRFPVLFQPPNAELEVLTTTGVVGTVAFLALFAVAGWYLFKMDPVYGTVGLAVVAARFAQAQLDLYWVAGQASLLWIMVGICYGVQVRDRARLAAEARQPVVLAAAEKPLHRALGFNRSGNSSP
jgi:hypothetical protein